MILEDRITIHLLSDTPYNPYDYLILIFNIKEHEQRWLSVVSPFLTVEPVKL